LAIYPGRMYCFDRIGSYGRIDGHGLYTRDEDDHRGNHKYISVKFISLFAGIGGFDLGLERAGMECVAQVEINPFCLRVLEKHYPNVARFTDVRECGKHNLPPADLICGGFPCQPHSIAGKRRGAADDRDLWPEYRRIIDECRPNWVLAENVPGIRTTILDQVLSDLDHFGYTTGTLVIPACAFNAPHRRERIFVVANSQGCSRRIPKLTWEESLYFGGNGKNGNVANPEHNTLFGDKLNGLQNTNTFRNNWWAVEPRMGGTPDGFPDWLDRHIGKGMSYEESKRTTKTLRELWNDDVSKVLWQYAGGLDRISQAEILFTFVREYQENPDETRIFLEGKKTSEGILRVVQKYQISASAPHQPGQGRQQAGKYTDTLQVVSPFLARHGEAEWMVDNWEDGISRIASGVPRRVERLRGLGNAVVPQVIEWIGRQIMEVERQLE